MTLVRRTGLSQTQQHHIPPIVHVVSTRQSFPSPDTLRKRPLSPVLLLLYHEEKTHVPLFLCGFLGLACLRHTRSSQKTDDQLHAAMTDRAPLDVRNLELHNMQLDGDDS
eukprot:5195622-Amphidinium_carterae.1